MDGKLESSPQGTPRGLGWKIVVILGVLIALLAVLTVWTVPRPTGDLYVALAAGRDILDGKLTKLDDWSFSTKGRVWVNQNWGTHLLYYLFYRAFGGEEGQKTGGVPDGQDSGEIGLVVLKLLILLTGATFLVLACHRRGVDWPIALIVAGGVIAAGRSFIDLRPNLTTLMFAPPMLYLLYRASDKPSRSWVVMIIFGLIWANLHGGFFLGLGTMVVWAGCMFLAPMFGVRWLHRWVPGLAWSVGIGAICAIWSESTLAGVIAGVACAGVHWIVAEVRAGRAEASVKGAKRRKAAESRERPEPVMERLAGAVNRNWPYVAATIGAFALAGIVTPFGIHNFFRDYSALKMSFREIWNLSHPFVVMAGANRDLWQSVIEWHSIFTASPRTFGTSWEFFGIVGLFATLVPLHVAVKLIKREPIDLEDLVLVIGVVVLAVAVFARAQPMWGKFARYVTALRQSPAGRLELGLVLEQRYGWLTVTIVYPCIGLFAAAVAVTAGARLLFGGQKLEQFSARRIGMLGFDVFMIGFGVFYLAFDARRFIPLSLILLAPPLARRMQWLLAALVRARWWEQFPVRVFWWVVLGVATVSAAPFLDSRSIFCWFLGVRGPGLVVQLMVLGLIAVMWLWTLATWLLPSLRPAWPTFALGAIVFLVIGLQGRSNLMRYLPRNPLVRNKSMLRNMIVYRMFPPGCRDFLYDNDLKGRVFNEWRWEGYLHWYCPDLELFLGGRAQQAYHVDTYKLQRRIISGRELPTALEEMKVRWVVVPMNPGYVKLLRAAVYSNIAKWVPVYCDGENVVLANSLLPECREVIARCMEGRVVIGRREPGKLTYRSAALAALSRGFCFSAQPVQAPAKAIAAIKESQRYPQDWPIYPSYTALRDLYKATPVKLREEIAYFEAENSRLAAMDYNRRAGAEILRCRELVLDMLAELYRLDNNVEKFTWARLELRKVSDETRAVVDRWR